MQSAVLPPTQRFVRQRKVNSVFRRVRHLFAPGLNVLGLVVFCLASSGCSETRTVNQVPTPDARADVRPTTVQARSTVQSQPTSQGEKIPRHPLPPLESPARTQGGFVGSEACQGCHADEYAAWSGSTHGRAGGPVSDDILIPKGGERRFSFSDTEVSLVSKADLFGFILSPRGQSKPTDSSFYVIDGVVGRDLMVGGGGQAYFHRRGDGLLMHLPFEFNRAERAWFCQRRTQVENSGREQTDYRWTRIDGSFPLVECDWPARRSLGYGNTLNCGNCHGSQIVVNYEKSTGQMATRFASLSINCESCHGPGERHVSLMQTDGHPGADIGLEDLSLLDKAASVRLCATCHVSKSVTRPGFRSGDAFDLFFSVLSMPDPARRVTDFDGRIADFGYQEGHLYSPCYLDGSMTCVDCHDPHAQSYRDVHGRPLKGRFDDGQCTGCHPAKDGTAHHGHVTGKQAPTCVDCHMPYHQHPAVPESFKLARSDHAITIPRPQIDADQGLRNACDRCHLEKGIVWQEETSTRLFGRIKPRPRLTEGLFQLAAVRDTGALSAVGQSIQAFLDLEELSNSPAVIRALSYLAQEQLRGVITFLQENTWAYLERLLGSSEPDIQAAAITSIFLTDGARPGLEQTAMSYLLGKGHGAAQLRAKVENNLYRLHSDFGMSDRGRSYRILEKWIPILNVQPTRWLATQAQQAKTTGRLDEAIQLYIKAAQHPELNRPTHEVGAGGGTAFQFLYEAGSIRMNQQRPAEAVPLFERAHRLAPANPPIKRGLWTALAMSNRPREALPLLSQYMKLVPSFVDGYLYKAQLLHSLGRTGEAVESVRKVLQRRPNDQRAHQLLKQLGGRR